MQASPHYSFPNKEMQIFNNNKNREITLKLNERKIKKTKLMTRNPKEFVKQCWLEFVKLCDVAMMVVCELKTKHGPGIQSISFV